MQRLFHRGQQEHQFGSARQIEDRRDPFVSGHRFDQPEGHLAQRRVKGRRLLTGRIQDALWAGFAANPDLPNWGIRRTDLAVLAAPCNHPIGSDTHRQKVSTGLATAQRETKPRPPVIMRRAVAQSRNLSTQNTPIT